VKDGRKRARCCGFTDTGWTDQQYADATIVTASRITTLVIGDKPAYCRHITMFVGTCELPKFADIGTPKFGVIIGSLSTGRNDVSRPEPVLDCTPQLAACRDGKGGDCDRKICRFCRPMVTTGRRRYQDRTTLNERKYRSVANVTNIGSVLAKDVPPIARFGYPSCGNDFMDRVCQM
jgi:hypothetical protein